MDRTTAEILYDSGKEPTVVKILEYDGIAIKYEQLSIENIQLKETIARLEKNSQNSSKPPSTDKPSALKQKKQKKKRKAGGQPGHKGTYRQLIPLEDVTEVIHVYPETCYMCNKELEKGKRARVVKPPFRWQVTEIPPITPTVTEYQCFSVKCKCGHTNKAQLPQGLSNSAFGPRLTAIIAYLVSVHHISRRGAEDLCRTLLGVNICLGSITKLLVDMSTALGPATTQLQEAVQIEPVINVDETGWRDRWMWIFVASSFIYFKVACSRSSQVLIKVLGNSYSGIICADRWGAYTKYHKGLMQICWAHLKRDFQWIGDIGQKYKSSDAMLFAKKIKKLMKRMMALWRTFKNGTISRRSLINKSKGVRSSIVKHLDYFKNSEDKHVRSLCRKLLKRQEHLFTFIFYEGVEPTNNSSERGIRPAVQWRKVCFGNRSEDGAIFTERLLTATRTCWLQNRNSLEFLVDTISAFRAASQVPFLL